MQVYGQRLYEHALGNQALRAIRRAATQAGDTEDESAREALPAVSVIAACGPRGVTVSPARRPQRLEWAAYLAPATRRTPAALQAASIEVRQPQAVAGTEVTRTLRACLAPKKRLPGFMIADLRHSRPYINVMDGKRNGIRGAAAGCVMGRLLCTANGTGRSAFARAYSRRIPPTESFIVVICCVLGERFRPITPLLSCPT